MALVKWSYQGVWGGFKTCPVQFNTTDAGADVLKADILDLNIDIYLPIVVLGKPVKMDEDIIWRNFCFKQ